MRKLIYISAIFVQAAFAQSENRVCFYEHANYQGMESCYTATESENRVGWVGSTRNDQFSSVKVGINVYVIGYDHASFQGDSWIYSNSQTTFNSANDKISSLVVKPKSDQLTAIYPTPMSFDNLVCFYEHSNYQGKEACYEAAESENRVAWVGEAWNDRFSSVKVGKNVLAIGYEHGGFQGANWGYSEDRPMFNSANDQISSIIVKLKSASASAYTAYGNSTWLTYHFLGAHNAHVNTAEGAWTFANQNKNYEELLNAGVRVLNIDIFDARSYGGKRNAYLCHGTCSGVLGANHIWAMPTFSNALQRIGKWTREHPNEIVTVTIEDYIDDKNLFNQALSDAYIGDIQFNPYKDRVGGKWPLLNSMVDSNKRLIILTSKQQNAGVGNGVGYDRDFLTENYWSLGGLGNNQACTPRWSDSPLGNTSKSMHVSHFRDVGSLTNAWTDNSYSNLSARINNQCYQASGGRKPNIILLDHATIGAGKQIVDELNRGRQ